MNRLTNYTPSLLLFFLIIGIIGQFHWKIWEHSLITLFFLNGLFILLLFLLRQKKCNILFSILSWVAFILLGITIVFLQNPKNHKNYYFKHISNDCFVTLTIQKILKPNNYYTKYIAKVSKTGKHQTCGYILLNIQKDSSNQFLRAGQHLYLNSNFEELPSSLNPYEFNYKNYLSKQYIYHQIFTSQNEVMILNERVISLSSLSSDFRYKIQQALKKQNFSENTLGVINALLLGQRQHISKELLENYTNAGAIHILAISGLHIGIILWILSFLLKPLERLKYGKIFKTGVIICFLWSFAFIAGLSASVVRAVTMFSFVSIALISNRKQHIEHSLITSMIFLLLAKPLFLFDVGFQLSYVAVFGIVWMQPLLSSIWKPKLFLTHKLWQLFTVSIAAQLGVLPISLYYFNQFSSLFIVSNIIIIPFLGSILAGGILIIILALTNLLPQEIAYIYEHIISLMNSIINKIASQEVFLFKNIHLSFPKMLLWYGCIILTYQLIIHKRNKHLLHTLFSIIALQLLSLVETHIKNTKEEFIVFHKNKASIIGVRKGKEMSIYSNSKNNSSFLKILSLYKTHESVKTKILPITPPVFSFKKDTILLIDSLGIYNINIENPIIIFQNSPKINITRLINRLKPKQIIADGSNYKSYIRIWKKTCEQQKTPFYYTGKHGAYILD